METKSSNDQGFKPRLSNKPIGLSGSSNLGEFVPQRTYLGSYFGQLDVDFLSRICILSLLSVILIQLLSNFHIDLNVFNVQDYGAVGDGKTDDSSAFLKAWNATCSARTGTATMIIPKGKTFLLHPINFLGPCKSSTVYITFSGTVKAPDDPGAWKGLDVTQWLSFEGIKGFVIDGFGQLDGCGQKWWDQSCKHNPKPGCTDVAPTALSFRECINVRMSNIYLLRSPQTHVLVTDSENVYLTSLVIRCPETSPNTDGIHISNSNNVWVHESYLESGDDCVSIGDHTTNIHVMSSRCGPGHGVSIGSLGRSGNEAHVENITVQDIRFYGTTNGARIKTWQVGRGFVRNVEFTYLNFTNVENPIIIDQNYGTNEMKTGVKISDVRYYRAFGTSKTRVAINLNCSENVPCTNISLEDVHLESASKEDPLISSCNNAFGPSRGTVVPKSCLK